MNLKRWALVALIDCLVVVAQAQTGLVRNESLFDQGWKFAKGDMSGAATLKYDDGKWEDVTVPHDWAIYGPFSRDNDLQNVAITQNLETTASVKTGRTGGLPYVGIGWYRRNFSIEDVEKGKKRFTLLFDGAMSEAHVYVNGVEVAFWPWGYNAFHCDITKFVHSGENLLAVRLENKPESSRWYSGAGLYRNVHLIVTNEVHVPVWGTYITTPFVSNEYAAVQLKTTVDNLADENVRVQTVIENMKGKVIAQKDEMRKLMKGQTFEQNFLINAPSLWSPESPVLYKAISKIFVRDRLVDEYTTRFGIRSVQVIAGKGFFLNGKLRKFQGVCNHHDLGPLGAAINIAALKHRLRLLKDMGCDAIRTAHNMPSPELVRLCDEMGFMMMVEPFDEWDKAKCTNGYHRFFNEWAEKDMINMLHHYRNNPSVVMWSIGNEVPTQCSPDGYRIASFLQDICHREDPTRPVTCGMDQVSCVLANGFAALLDVPGFNYRVHRYKEAYAKLPQGLVLGSETSSTVSSRGIYKFPIVKKADVMYDDHQSSSYDLEYCSWSNVPDEDLAIAEDYNWTMGQFVWSGFDYLGEPSPYDTDAWPNHSSLFGIIDLANIPKDRYYLYRSIWNTKDATLHILPHWNWQGREGKITPVFVYTSYPSAELFINGKSYGKQSKNNTSLQNRYRLMWMNAIYEPGEVKVVAYDADGKVVAQKVVHTAGKPHHIELTADRSSLSPDGKDLVYINVRVVDKEGNLCPLDKRLIHFSVKGCGKYRAAANGDPTCLEMFHLPEMHLFSGQLTAIVQSSKQEGEIVFEARAKGVKNAKLNLRTKGTD